MSIEAQRQRFRRSVAAERSAQDHTEAIAVHDAGSFLCACCGTENQREVSFPSAEGLVCGVCQGELESEEMLKRGARNDAGDLFFFPAYVSLAMGMVGWILMLIPSAIWLLAAIPAITSLAGVRGVIRGVTAPDLEAADRVRLVMAGLWCSGILAFLAASVVFAAL